MSNEYISDLTLSSGVATTDLIETETAGGDSYKATLAQIIGLARSLSGDDYDIGSGNETFDLDTATVGGAFRVSWSGGDGTYNFQFDNSSGKTIDGIAAASYIGQGMGHLDLYCVNASTFITLNRGEIWDSDGGGWSGYHWEKYLQGILTQERLLVASSLDGVQTLPLEYPDTNYTVNIGVYKDIANARIGLWYNISTTTFEVFIIKSDNGTAADSGGCWQSKGRWTTSYPRIT
jgi:hypothetical protein